MASTLTRRITTLPRLQKQAIVAASDVIVLLAAGYLAYALRLNTFFQPNLREALLIGVLPILGLPVFVRLGLYRSVIRYIGEHAVWATVQAVTLVAILWAVIGFLTIPQTGAFGMPRSVPFVFWTIALVGVSGTRFLARWLLRRPDRSLLKGRPVLIYGAGEAGMQLAASLRSASDLAPIGFIDDDPRLQGSDIAGLRIFAPARLDYLIEHYGVQEVIVCLTGASSEARRKAVEFLEGFPIRIRILPPLADIASGRHLVNLVREVEITDLLGREPVAPISDLLTRCIEGKVVLVTGAGGSIGSELCRTVSRLGPARLVLLEASEPALYQIDRRLRAEAPEVEIVPCIGSIGNRRLVAALLAKHRVQTIYHAAAHKHVPLVESNVAEAVHNNIGGTRTLVDLALEHGVEAFVLVSTDKAVRPTSVMGGSKRWAELIVQEADQKSRAKGTSQRFCAVRFGNVLGSSGSVIPLFKEQIAGGGPITLTHPEVTRYFMSVEEAVALIIQAGSMAEGGEVFVLEMGEPVKVYDLARKMIEITGHRLRDDEHPNGDIEIVSVGLRPGEKLYEELLTGDSSEPTDHPRIMRAREPRPDSGRLAELLGELDTLLAAGDEAGLRRLVLEAADGTLGTKPTRRARASAGPA